MAWGIRKADARIIDVGVWVAYELDNIPLCMNLDEVIRGESNLKALIQYP